MSEYIKPTDSATTHPEDEIDDDSGDSVSGGSFNRDNALPLLTSPTVADASMTAGGYNGQEAPDKRKSILPPPPVPRQPETKSGGGTIVGTASDSKDSGVLPANWMDAIGKDTFKPRQQHGKALSSGASVSKVIKGTCVLHLNA